MKNYNLTLKIVPKLTYAHPVDCSKALILFTLNGTKHSQLYILYFGAYLEMWFSKY